MTANVIAFEPYLKEKNLKTKAKEFVDLYTSKGKMIAAKWALKNIPEVDYKEAHTHITAEFESRGYTFNGKLS